MTKKRILFLLFNLVWLSSYAFQPDSVYVSKHEIFFFKSTPKELLVKEISFGDRNEMIVEERSANRYDSTYYDKPLIAYSDLAKDVNLSQVLLGNSFSYFENYTNQDTIAPYDDYVFFAPDRYAKVRWETMQSYSRGDTLEYKDEHHTNINVWKQYSVDGLNFVLLYDLSRYFSDKEQANSYGENFDAGESPYELEGVVMPLVNGEFYMVADRWYPKNDILVTQPKKHNYNPSDLLRTRQLMYDTDSLKVNGKYGLYTMTGKEVIAPIYDSIRTEEVLVRGFRNGRVDLINYMGEKIIENKRTAIPTVYTYQILDDDGNMYFIDRSGKKTTSYSYSFMSTDDILYPISYDVVLLKPTRKYKFYSWVKFKYSWSDFDRLKAIRHPFSCLSDEEMKFYKVKDIWEVMAMKDDFYDNYVLKYGLDTRIAWYKSDYSNAIDDLYGYNIEACNINKKYKEPKLITGDYFYYRSGDYQSLPPSWIIAKQRSKYGVVDITDDEKEILPFAYDDIEGHNIYLILKKKGLIAYYPISAEPRYKILENFNWRLARFQLPDGRWGWLSKTGEEYMDNE